MGPLLPRVADQIKEAISVKGRTRPNCPEALQVSTQVTAQDPNSGCHALWPAMTLAASFTHNALPV